MDSFSSALETPAYFASLSRMTVRALDFKNALFHYYHQTWLRAHCSLTALVFQHGVKWFATNTLQNNKSLRRSITDRTVKGYLDQVLALQEKMRAAEKSMAKLVREERWLDARFWLLRSHVAKKREAEQEGDIYLVTWSSVEAELDSRRVESEQKRKNKSKSK
ncbi:hypothetical protein BDV95DRAFT_603434 [Massariosphaeria phaeospora]|uniref:Uncharacterized protein n=1 Tax=Massariosphaeria phaeospora TaxID=100035 RepID=A0A7C8IJT6_9PLEO|nr:hypothetical protein BDV95DRAFT_603434 [Massariosphaeria phaeospora]